MVKEELIDTRTAIMRYATEEAALDLLLPYQRPSGGNRFATIPNTQELHPKAALDLILPYHRSEFEGIFRAMDGLPVTIRLLDPPLHELLPEGDLQQIVSQLTEDTGMTEDQISSRIKNLSEVNPMLGFRGCRLGISYLELTEMQVRAIFQAGVTMSNQQIGATYIPAENIRERTKELKADSILNVPGLLVIDTPGHESFKNLRSRGSSLCDIAILVGDIMHGLEPQTIESLNLLRMRNTEFIVALNKVERLYGWKTCRNAPIGKAMKLQSKDVQLEFEHRLTQIIT
ncbi:unnamed protein product [Lactuca virosa]|uniref:Tr-type G domain-containing protein n=1 Tax=Lactuca virosa TaxID=75947 RepID=A0AAU9PJ46_9ASTR|nr:unnamed protein product [Lactuca virosa]